MLRCSCFFLVAYYIHTISGASMEDTKSLLTFLFKNYSKEVRPVSNQDRPVNVNVGLSLASLNDFDEVTGVISVSAILDISWTDESLVWDPDTYGNLTSVTFNQRNIWLPQMFLANAAEEFKPISNKHYKVTVTSNGTVLWKSGGILKPTCTPDVSKFPFDNQTCTLMITVLGYSHAEVSLVVPSSTMDFAFFNQSVEWIVTGSSTAVWEGPFDIGSFTFRMTRRHLNFLVNVVLPIMLLGWVNPFVFILPYNSGERASYSITVLLSFSVYMTVVSDRMPASSDPMSYLSYFLFSLFSFSVIIVQINIFQMRLYGKNEDDEPIPQWICSFMRNSQIICRGTRIKDTREYLVKGDQSQNDTRKTMTDKKPAIERLQSITEVDHTFSSNDLRQEDKDTPYKGGVGNSVQSCRPENQENLTWYIVGKDLDKLYFTLFHIINVTFSIVFFMVALN